MTEIERITFFNGQSLTADDLNFDQLLGKTMRWLHNRSLHDWGIVTGLGVSGRRGDRSVTVAPGMALDRSGHEIILSDPVVKGVPVVGGQGGETKFYLVAIYVRDDDQKAVEYRNGVCASGGAVRLSDDPRIEWRAPGTVKEGAEVILATVRVANCGLSRSVSGAGRRSALPPAQPFLGSGQTAVATTVWQPVTAGAQVIGFSTHVNTSAAGFGDTPVYIAHIEGGRFLASPPGPLFAAPLTRVVNPGRNGFTLEALLPNGGSAVNPAVVRHAQQGPQILHTLGWHIVWMGFEG